jgi:hypothetical protein
MKKLLLLLLLMSTATLAQTQTIEVAPDNLDFIKDPVAYYEMQKQIEEELKAAVLEDSKHLPTQQKLQVLESLAGVQADIVGYQIQMEEVEEKGKKVKKARSLYIVWGYNRAWHGNADMTFQTKEGTFTVHDAQGRDRPSPFDWETYFSPSKLSIPQYVVKVGYMFDENWGIELGQDHMKWVFVNDVPYTVSGDFDATVYVDDPNHEWPLAQDFDQIKESGNMTWLGAEHSDGYNYVNLSAVYNLNILTTKKEVIKIDFRPNAGVGIMYPKTRVFMHKDQMWNWDGLDNKFHIAGYGAHAEAKIRVTFFRRFFVEAAARGTFIKINDALVNGSNDRMYHSMIPSLQVYGAFGMNIPIGGRKKRKK